MNREQAKLELDATTLRPQDASAEAKVVALSDPTLSAWLIKRTAFDEKASDANTASIHVPQSLIHSILP